ncbi:MAG: hypothetical protein AAF990_28015 [Bacteroidota bacterium]
MPRAKSLIINTSSLLQAGQVGLWLISSIYEMQKEISYLIATVVGRRIDHRAFTFGFEPDYYITSTELSR